MKINTKKGSEAVTGLLQRTSDLGKKTIADVQAGAMALSEKSKQESYSRRLKKYNPLFPDLFFSPEFNIPNMIMIRDDAERRGIDVCEGAIGWLGKQGGMEVLYLYDEAVEKSRIQFIPTASCNAVYYVDSFDRNRFVRVDCIFSKAHEERLAELKHIAYALGAKKCSIEIVESSKEVSVSKKRADRQTKVDANIDVQLGDTINIEETDSKSIHQNITINNNSQRSGKVTVSFSGSSTPRKPKLKWFAHDDNIKSLIEMRFKGNNSINSEVLEISGASSATMSKETACSIDDALSVMKVGEMRTKGNASMEKQVVKENRSTLVFSIEF